MNLSTLQPSKGATKNRKRIGRGTGSGHGGTSTRGNKGAGSRSGYKSKIGFEGGQMPLYRRVPKFGFNNPDKVTFKPINLDVLQDLSASVSVLNPEIYQANGLMSKNHKVKVLGRGELKAKVEVFAHAFSKAAIDAIEKAGGKATVIK